jgi:branched-subunit amino acid aminotransferase/4-amino-4-deoxychorismate lyase
MYSYCFFDGTIIKSDKPVLKLNDIAVLRGFAAFDFMRIYKGKPFQFKSHMKRFKNTCNRMGLKNRFSDDEIEKVLYQLILKNKQKDYQVRFVLTGGETKNGLQPSIPVFYILFEKLSDLPNEYYTNGAKIITYEHQRTLPDAKNSNYMQAVLLQNKKIKSNAVEILYTYQGNILEASTSNIFIVKNKTLYTPKDNILKGITRKLIMDIARKLAYTVKEEPISLKKLYDADEVFLTATNKKVLPIVRIDSHVIKKGEVGNITKEFLEEYNTLIK